MSEAYFRFRSNYLNGTVDVSVILPNPFLGHDPEKFYNSKKKYPVVWLLHGGSETYADWITYTSAARLAIFRGAIFVAPTIPNSDFMNQPLVGEGYPIVDFFFHELMPFVYNWLPVSDDPAQNFLVGDSMGAEAAWRYGLLRPDAFACIAPIGKQPCDYRYLETYRGMTAREFAREAKKGVIPAAYGPEGGGLHVKELNNICKFEMVGDFLDSIENTMVRFEEAAEKGGLPNFYVVGDRNDTNLAAFQKHVEQMGTESVSFDLIEKTVDDTEFSEIALEKFMDFVGLENVGTEDKSVPILPGVHPFEDETIGRVLH